MEEMGGGGGKERVGCGMEAREMSRGGQCMASVGLRRVADVGLGQLCFGKWQGKAGSVGWWVKGHPKDGQGFDE